jgi:hypothetical protein
MSRQLHGLSVQVYSYFDDSAEELQSGNLLTRIIIKHLLDFWFHNFLAEDLSVPEFPVLRQI